jgi:hypothetical protein
MSWGSTAFTPIVTRNEPPFGFAEAPNPPDFPVSDWNPYVASDYLKDRVESCLQTTDRSCTDDGMSGVTTLVEGFDASKYAGTQYFFMMLIFTIMAGFTSSKVAYAISGKFVPLEKLAPFLSKLPPQITKSVKLMTRFGSKALPSSDIVYNIVMPIMVFATIWLSNTIVLQTHIYMKCGKIDSNTLKTSATSALAGAVPCAVLTIVLSIVLFILNRIPVFTPFISIAGALGGLTVAYVCVLLGTNFIFGSAAGLTSALNNTCNAAPAPAPTPTPA